jgi:sulfur carrier protein ThiS
MSLNLTEPATVGDALDAAELAREHIGLVSVNGIIVSADTLLRHGDVVEIIAAEPEPSAPPLPPELLPQSRLGKLVNGALLFGRKGFARVIEFTPSRLNFSWVTDQLAVGGAFHTSDIPRLRRLGIDGVVDCREEASDDEAALRQHGIDFLRLPTPDVHKLSQDALDVGVAWANERIDRGEKIYVHCLHGVGRGPLLGCCILVSRGQTAVGALQTVKTRRWQASPNEEQLGALIEYAERHRADLNGS